MTVDRAHPDYGKPDEHGDACPDDCTGKPGVPDALLDLLLPRVWARVFTSDVLLETTDSEVADRLIRATVAAVLADPAVSAVLAGSGEDVRLVKIAEVHRKWVGPGGLTSGDCRECGYAWPCPTYRWATVDAATVTPFCTWDMDECELGDALDGHTHNAATPEGADRG